MPTRNVVLTDYQDKLITEWVDSGRYQNASEVLRDGLRMVEERESVRAAKLEALRAAVNVGIAAFEAGDYDEVDDSDLDAYFERLDAQDEAEASR